ncbi:unnamed protein product [Leptidea sinapis]|uniref:Major facilitator superfamily (MFS) profile domain-containing protein n=2 Tax=Leptidea sinapis TaxID=189913 RepID=A0A5E4PYF2_9NEOP|nr:unnamed protein product [Leptidea sinapis]
MFPVPMRNVSLMLGDAVHPRSSVVQNNAKQSKENFLNILFGVIASRMASVEKGEREKVDLDTILENEVGPFGKYQIVTLLLAALPIISAACVIPQCDAANPEFSPTWILNAIPGTSDTNFENCERYVNLTSAVQQSDICPANWFDSNRIEGTFGTLLVLPITGYISDRWGRRVALTLNAFNTGWIGLVRSFVNSYEWFLILEVLESTVGAAGATISSMFALGQVILGFIAWGVPSWRPLTQVVYAPQLLVISYFWILSESVRWLMTKSKYEEAERILIKVAKTNKKELSRKSLEALRDTAEYEKTVEKPKEPWLPILVCRSRVILTRCFVSPIWWITNTLVYYGMSINAVNLSGNRYLNYVAVAAIEIPGYWTAILLLDRVGRKPVLIFGYFLCVIPQCDAANPEFSPTWILNAIPGTSDTNFENCERYVNLTSAVQQSDFDMACDEWRRSLIGSIRTIGTLLVLPITGYISDRWGRRVALTLNAFNTGWIGLVRSFVNSYEWFLILEVLESTVGAVTELVGPKYRVIAGATISSMFALGQVILGFIAWGVPSWRSLTQVVYAPQLLVISYFWILSESVRWLMSKSKYEEAEKILIKVAKTNKKELSRKSLEALRDTAEYEKTIEKPKEPWLPILVCRSKVILSRCFVSPIWWITNTLVYYGMSINAVNLSGNRYLNYVAVAAIEIPGYWTAIFLLDRVGRKPASEVWEPFPSVLFGSFAALSVMSEDKVASSNGEGRNKISLETLLVEEIGQFGRYQCRMVGVTIVFVIFASWAGVEYLFTTARSVRTFGSLMALPITGYISDHWGRRTALCINAFNTAWLGVTRYFADTYIGFLISEVVEATFGSGGYSCAYILLMEVVGPKYRVAAGATFKTVFSIGQIMLALIAWAVPDWRTLTLVITISYYWLIYESIRWHLSKGHYEEAGITLKKVAKINGKQLSEKSIEWLRVSAEELQKERELEKHMKATEPWLIVILFRHKRVLLRVLVSPVWWITSTLIYYGLSVNAVNMSGNRYLNYIAVAAVEIPGYWVAVLLLNRIGRKPVLVDMNTVSMIIFLVGKWSIAMGAALFDEFPFILFAGFGIFARIAIMALGKEAPSHGDERSKISLDTLLVEEIGQFGRYQWRICLIPECDVVGQIEFHPEWILNAVPESGSSFDNCRRFSPVNSTAFANTCPAHWFDRNTISECEDFVYQNTNTVVYDYGLACDEWRRSLIGSVRTFGTLTALPITGYISDRWGRRTALCINAFNTAWLGVTRYFADTYIGFLISEITMGLLAWAVPNWRYLTLTLYIPQFITVFYYWLMFESIRWYISKGRYQEAGSTLKKVATINGKQLSDDSIETLRVCAEEEKKQKELDLASRSSEPWLIVILFRYKRVLLRVCVSPVWWITTTFIYYGLSINSVNMSGNQYVNYIAVAAVEIPGYWAAVVLMSIIGRKLVLAGAFWLCCACQIAYIFMPQAYLIGKLAIATVMTTVYVYTTELYPTRYRHTLFAFSSMMGRIGSIIAPLTPAFGQALFEEFPFILFAGFSLISGGLVLLTPETMGTKLPDTMEEASNLGLKSSKLQPTL